MNIFKKKTPHKDMAAWLEWAKDVDFKCARIAGRNVLMRCPFHEEKTPSFAINPDTGLFYCFGCGKGGKLEDLKGIKK